MRKMAYGCVMENITVTDVKSLSLPWTTENTLKL